MPLSFNSTSLVVPSERAVRLSWDFAYNVFPNASRRCGVPVPGLSIAGQHLVSARMETVSSFSPIDYSLYQK